MPELIICPQDFQLAAGEFEEAYKESQATLLRVQKAMAVLENKWDGASRQVFFRNYREWHTAMGGISVLLMQIFRELNGMAEEFKKADHL